MGQIEKIANQFRQIFNIEADNAHYDESETAILLAHAYPERIACARPGNNAQFQLANGKIAMAGHRDDLADETWLAIAHVSERENIGKYDQIAQAKAFFNNTSAFRNEREQQFMASRMSFIKKNTQNNAIKNYAGMFIEAQ